MIDERSPKLQRLAEERMDQAMQSTLPSPLAASEGEISNSEIAAVAKGILEGASEPILLANLGSRLSKHYGRALREILANRKLKPILESELGGNVEFSGELSKISVKLLSEDDKLNVGTYHPTIWAAFFKPVEAPKVGRAIKSSRRFDFRDVTDQSEVPAGWHYITANLIPDGALPKADREAAAKMSIHDWCAREDIEKASLLKLGRKTSDSEVLPQATLTKDVHLRSVGLSSLISMIEAIPEDRRKSHSLSLDLIYQLIS